MNPKKNRRVVLELFNFSALNAGAFINSIFKKFSFTIFCLLFVLLYGCKKLVQVDAPITTTNATNVFTSDETAAATLTGIYTKMSNSIISNNGFTGISIQPELSADLLSLNSGLANQPYLAYYRNALSNSNTPLYNFWIIIYPYVFYANAALEGVENSNALTPSVKQQLLGEAKFIRAFCYFYLVNLYGDIPLAVSTDYKINSLLPRTSKDQVYQQIISDLKDAQQLLSDNYLGSDITSTTSERVRPNKSVATALLARVYLYMGDFAHAEEQATLVINKTALYQLTTLNNVFLKNSSEAIWQFQPVLNGYNTQEARLLILTTGIDGTHPLYLSGNLINDFESGDNRKTTWIGSVTSASTTYYYSYKYKVRTPNAPVSEYEMVLRLSEQFLIRAEARVRKPNSDIAGALSDLNLVRNRAGLSNYTGATDQSSLLSAILHERKVELFMEWGHRWLDLKRTGMIDAIMSIVTPNKGGTWEATDKLYPIPATELQRDPNLIQNPGY